MYILLNQKLFEYNIQSIMPDVTEDIKIRSNSPCPEELGI